MTYDVAIIGGGLAGSAAAIRLARRGYRVVLLEKRALPASKLCGEFLSPEVQAQFRALGVEEAVQQAGARPLRQACITTASGASFQVGLPGTAWGLSRFMLDHLLFAHAQQAGAEAHDDTTAQEVEGSLEDGFRVHTRSGKAFAARLVLGAYGRRGRLDRALRRPFLQESTPRVAFKAHYEGAELGDRIELHAFSGGYCGIAPVEGERVNVCWIAQQSLLQEAGGSPETMIQAAMRQNTALEERLAALTRVSSAFKAVSQVSFAQKELFAGDVCMIGDAAAMIAPLCGDGMAMALQSAALAADPAEKFLNGRLDPGAYKRHYRSAWRGAFRGRLRLGRWVHRALSTPWIAGIGVRACHHVPACARWLIRHTRG